MNFYRISALNKRKQNAPSFESPGEQFSSASSSVQTRQQRLRPQLQSASTKNASSGASRKVLNHLLHMRLRAQNASGLQQSCPSEECVICAESFDTDHIVTTLPCGHMHHSNCILHWLHRQCTCPTCRFDLNKHANGEYHQEEQDTPVFTAVLKIHPCISSSNTSAVGYRHSDNWDLIMKRTMRMRMEAHQMAAATVTDLGSCPNNAPLVLP